MATLKRITTLCGLASIIIAAPALFAATTITVNPATRYQTIEGMGAMGGMNPWFSYGPYFNDWFLNMVIDTLGMSMFRTEFYPRPDQQSEIAKQFPYWKALLAKAQKSGEEIKLTASIWTPPASFKTNNNTTDGRLIMSKTLAFGDYCVEYLKYWKQQVGVDLYALGPQNEPQLGTAYNSCQYSDSEIGTMVRDVAARIAASGLPTKVHFCDDIFWGSAWFPQQAMPIVKQNATADAVVSAVSMHYGSGDAESIRCYTDYVRVGKAAGKNAWNTEFGNGPNTWAQAWQNALAKYQMLNAGYTAIIYWLIGPHTNPAQSDESIMYDLKMGPKAAVVRAFFRFIRPGAVRVGVTGGSSSLLVLAFQHEKQKTTTVLILNNSGSEQQVSVTGTGLPQQWDVYKTASGVNCTGQGTAKPGDVITIPAGSMVSLYNTPTTVGIAGSVRNAQTAAAAPRDRAIVLLNGRAVVQDREGVHELPGREIAVSSRADGQVRIAW